MYAIETFKEADGATHAGMVTDVLAGAVLTGGSIGVVGGVAQAAVRTTTRTVSAPKKTGTPSKAPETGKIATPTSVPAKGSTAAFASEQRPMGTAAPRPALETVQPNKGLFFSKEAPSVSTHRPPGTGAPNAGPRWAGKPSAANKIEVPSTVKEAPHGTSAARPEVAAKHASKQIPLKHQFVNESELLKHFERHGGEFKGAYSTAEEYLQGANFLIKNGHKVKYEYMGKEHIGYVRFMGNRRNLSFDEMLNNFSKRELGLAKDHKFGEAKFEFLAIRDDGSIATYHTKSAERFYKALNQNKKNDMINVEELSCKMM